MKKRCFSLFLALALILTALPATTAKANSATNYDTLVDYISTYGTADSNGIMTLADYYKDEDNSMDYYFMLQDLGTALSFELVVYSLTDPGVDSATTLLLTKHSATVDVQFAMLFRYGGEYVDGVQDERTLTRSKYKAGQTMTITSGGYIIPADDATEYYTGTMTMLCNFWDMIMYYELGFGLDGLGFTSFEGYRPVDCTLSGTVTSYGDGDSTVTLTDSTGAKAVTTVSGSCATYSFENVPAGTYTLSVSKDNHVTREYTVTLEEDMALDVTINLLGDTTGDGKVNMKDWSCLYDHISETSTLTDYALQCADVTGDGKVNMKDWSRLYDHISEVAPLW